MIAFDYEGKSYVVDFQRTKRVVGHQVVKQNTADRIVKHVYATYPDTHIFIREMVPEKPSKEWPIRWQARAKYCDKDRFSLEGGRMAALKKLTGADGALYKQKDLCQQLWTAYNTRYRRSKNPTIKDQVQDILQRIDRLAKNNRASVPLRSSLGLMSRALKMKIQSELLEE